MTGAGAREKWKAAWQRKSFRAALIASLAAFLLIVNLFTLFLSWAEAREGYLLHDPVLELFRPLNISLITFTVTYLPVLIGIIVIARDPLLLLRLVQCYALLLLLRMLTMYLVPLEPPASIIPLHDPLLELTAYQGRLNLKDLFFSGHTATLFLFFLLLPVGSWKRFFLSCALILGTLVLLQHVHYTVDVLAAPFFSWLSVKIVSLLHKAAGNKSAV